MGKLLSIILFFFLMPSASAQVLPKDGARLRHRMIGFSFPAQQAAKYKIEIATGNRDSEDTFKKNIVRSVDSKTNKIIIEVPLFGRDYTWRVIYTSGKAVVSTTPLHHFATIYAGDIDTGSIRLRILQPALKYDDHFVFVDGNNALYNMKGEVVWYFPFPDKDKNQREGTLVRDLKMTPQGTITFLHNQHAYEVNYYGDTLWKGPDNGAVSGEDSERYHHEFTRLANGHYMVLGTEHVNWDHDIIAVDTSVSLIEDEGIKRDTAVAHKKRTPFGTLIEYDEKGNVVWSWKSSKYFLGSDIVNYRPEGKVKKIDVHENAFFFDEHDSVIYISFRNISRIVKVKYPGGNVIGTYGEVFTPGRAPVGNGLFCDQHACRISKEGYLYLYNNNACNDDKALPTVIMMKESSKVKDSLVKVWEYECNIDDIHLTPVLRKAREKRKMDIKNNTASGSWKGTLMHYTSGGNVIELPDRSLFVCMNAQYGKLFIINRDKKVLWSAAPEKINPGNKEWYVAPQLYRASIITRKELEQLIWLNKSN
ncbi:MAG: hypothetical protein JWQ38_2740 [Flavipsychrobacter sp.]|nr:hypothetical protein [Flavipsychrobacter sp.]